jgi:tetratricopeptide (TPR) repeat protein
VTKAIDLDGESDAAFNLRASVHYARGDYAAALADHERAHELDPDDAGTLNFLAWIRATSPDDSLRDGGRALSEATRACEATGHANPGFLDTLAAAYAELGRFDDAVKWQQKAISLVPPDEQGDYRTRLAVYRDGKAYRDGTAV